MDASLYLPNDTTNYCRCVAYYLITYEFFFIEILHLCDWIYSYQEHSKEELNQWQLVRVSDDFRVIALGLPVPKYQGNPLDPPLRSRFQARFIDTDSYKVSKSLFVLSLISLLHTESLN